MNTIHTALAKAAAITVLASFAGSAAADTQTLTVDASVQQVCAFTNAARTMAFGSLNPNAAADTAGTMSGAVTYKCTKGTTPATLTAGNGANFSVKRRMSNGTDFLPYTLTLSAATAGAGFSAGKDQTVTITGGVLAADYLDASSGSYTDSVTLTVNP